MTTLTRHDRLAAGLGAAVLALAWGGPALDGGSAFTLHMATHMAVVVIAAPLLALPLARRAAPPAALGPLTASALEFVAVWGWHTPQARRLAEGVAAGAVLEQASFLAAGVLLWWTCLAPGRAAAGAIGLLLTSMHMTLLGALIGLAPRPLYATGMVTCLGVPLDALADQRLGGVVMLLAGAAATLAGGLVLLARVLAGEARS